jgi:hypothetical protein
LNPDILKKHLDDLPITQTNYTPSQAQSRKLRDALQEFMLSYVTGDFEVYKAFRYRASSSIILAKRILLGKIGKVNPDEEKRLQTESGEAVEERAWAVVTDGKPVWVACAMDAFACSVEESAVVKFYQAYPASFLLIPEGAAAGSSLIPATHITEPSPESVLETSGSLITAHFRCLVRVSTTHPPILFICRLYWNPAMDDWTPWTLERIFVGEDPGNVMF